jgi:diguanylate cyclase (GGDEF)-like protein
MNKVKELSLASRSLRYKLKISFYLILILPLLISFYMISNYILPHSGPKIEVVILMIVNIFVTISGFWLMREIIKRVILITSEAKLLADGEFDHRIDTTSSDEVGDLAGTWNRLAERIRDNMEEMKGFSERTAEINLEIQKRVVVLSSLLQISSLVSQGTKLEDILNITLEKSRQIGDSDIAYFLFKEPDSDTLVTTAVEGISSEYLLNIRLDMGKSIFNSAIKSHTPLILDESNPVASDIRINFYEEFKLKNTLALPIYSRGELLGILGIGNTREKFSYEKDSLEFIDIFAKQIAIAIQNDTLVHRIEKLEIKDVLTGLYNESYIRGRLQEEIKRAVLYRRPCSFVLLNVDNFREYRQAFGELMAEATLKNIASLIKGSVSDIDRVARFGDNEFAILLPEKNKPQATEVAENIRKKIEHYFSREADSGKRITVSGGLSENPLDGIAAEEIIRKAKDCMASAKTKGKNNIVNKIG